MSDISNEAAVRDGKSAASEARNAAASVAGKMRDAGSHAADYVRGRFEHLNEGAHHAFDSGRETAKRWEHSAEDYVKTRPMRSLLIAAGVGILIGVLWKRRD